MKSFESVFPLCKFISDEYFSYAPDKWLSQYEKYKRCPQEFVIPDTNFSTLTINMDFRTACHKDKGDCKEGLTAFTRLESLYVMTVDGVPKILSQYIRMKMEFKCNCYEIIPKNSMKYVSFTAADAKKV